MARGTEAVDAVAEASARRQLALYRTLSRWWTFPVLAIAGIWVTASLVLSEITGRVTDWYVMTDELRYERLAISVARTGSPLPRVHGVLVRNLDQLYPWLLAPIFRHGAILADLHHAHVVGAWVMCSACIPAFLLARRVTGSLWVGYLIGTLSICLPWMIYASFLLTEVVGYPAFLWALLAMQASICTPSRRNDVLALGAVVLAFLARTELVAVAAAFPVALLAFEVGAPRQAAGFARLKLSLSSCVRAHPIPAFAYTVLLVVAAGYLLTGGGLAGLTDYASQTNLSVLPHGIVKEFLGHIAQIAFGVAILPFVVGAAWAFANAIRPAPGRERHAFACLVSSLVPLLVFEIAKWDLTIGPVTYDRYLFYLVTPILLAFVCAVLDRRPGGLAIVASGAVVCAGFAIQLQESFTWSNLLGPVDADSPVSIFYRPIVDAARSAAAAKATLIGATILLTAGFVVARAVFHAWRGLSAVFVVLLAVVMPLETYGVFNRLLTHNGTANRPLTGRNNGTAELDWVDGTPGTGKGVTIVPYRVSRDYYVSLRYWRDLEFWNRSVQRDAEYPSADEYAYTGVWFPKVTLAIDPDTGNVGPSLTPNVVQAVTETRFRIAGVVQAQTPEAMVIRAETPWRLSWMTTGLYDDGWMKPRVPAKIRVYASRGQRHPLVYVLSLQATAPDGVSARTFTVASNLEKFHGTATAGATTFANAIRVCVPPGRYADVAVRAAGASPIPGDLSDQGTLDTPRLGSIALADISVSDNTGGPCRP